MRKLSRYDSSMHPRKSYYVWILPLLAFLGLFLWGLNASYPLLGHDYEYHIGHLLGGRWHFGRQWLLPFRYSPHLCGGVPIYGNNAAMYYSLPQILAFVLDPWYAIQISIVIFLLVGFYGWYRFACDILRMKSRWAYLLAFVVSANGFYLLHMVVGHLVYISVPLLGILLWLLLAPQEKTRKILLSRTCFFALLTAVILYGGGYITVLFALLALLIALPLDLFFHRSERQKRLRTLLIRFDLFGGLALLLCISKITAVYSFMRFFPRLIPFNQFTEGTSTLAFMAKSFWAFPQTPDLFSETGLSAGIHEMSMFLSPVTLPGILCLLWLGMRSRRRIVQEWKSVVFFGIYALLLLIFFVQLIRGYGFLITPLKPLPVLASIHVVVRFLYPFSVLVSILGIAGLMLFVRSMPSWRKYENVVVLSFIWITIGALLLAYGTLFQSEGLPRNVRYDRIQERLQPQDVFSRYVSHVRWGGTFPFHVLGGTTGVRCNESMFGYRGEQQITSLAQGLAHRESDGFFNLNNPACMQYPEENDCAPGDRIAVSDRDNFEKFRRGKHTTWKFSRAQKISDWVSLVALVGSTTAMLAELLCFAPFKYST